MSSEDPAATGVPGLDDILSGGLSRGRVFLLEGMPGTGKTTVAMQFLLEGVRKGEKVLYLTLSESEEELRATAAEHGWTLDGVEIVELISPDSLIDEKQQQSLLYSSDLELVETTRRIFEAFTRFKPARLVLDSLSEIRLLSQSSLRYRRQMLALKHYFAGQGTIVVMLDDMTTDTEDKTVHSVAHGVVRLEEIPREYGPERRRIRVVKYRGRGFRGGYHDFLIEKGGARVFPRLISAEHRTSFERDRVTTEAEGLDGLLGGGLERGSSVLILGPAGTGKSLLALTFVAAAVAKGEKAAMFVFDEEIGLLADRARGLGIDIGAMIEAGALKVEQIDAAELSPGEFSARVRRCVEDNGAKTVVVDSLNGYQAAMPGENALVLHMHELLQYLNRQGATTLVTLAQHGLLGDPKTPVDVTYLADTVILLRYFEMRGRIRRAISVVKKRTGAHEDTIRELSIGAEGVRVGEAVVAFQGAARGVRSLFAESPDLIEDRH